jgi:hypothetical protein
MSDHLPWIMLDEAVRAMAERCGIPGHQAWVLLSRDIETQEINARCCFKRDNQPKPGWEPLDPKWLLYVSEVYPDKSYLQFNVALAIRAKRTGQSLRLPPGRAWNVSVEAVRFDELYPKPPPEDPAIVSIPGSLGTPAAADTAGQPVLSFSAKADSWPIESETRSIDTPASRKGRKKQFDDGEQLRAMLDLLAEGTALTVNDAATQTADRYGQRGQSPSADTYRYRKGFTGRFGTAPPQDKTWAEYRSSLVF